MIKVVLADDNKVSLDVMGNFLEKYNGIEIVGRARNGAEELKYIIEQKPDVIVTDIEMPVMTGIDVIEKIQNISKQPTIIVITGATSPFIQSKLNSLPIYQILRKPIDYDVLANEIITIGKLIDASHEVVEIGKRTLENKKKKSNKIVNFLNKLKNKKFNI